MSFDGAYIVSGTKNGWIYTISNSGEILNKTKKNNGVVNVKITPNGNYIVAGSRDGGVYAMSNNGKLLWQSLDDKGVYSVAINPDGTKVAAGSMDTIYILSKNGKEIKCYQTYDDKYYLYSINSLAISLDSSTLVSTSRECIFYFNHDTKKEFDLNECMPTKKNESTDTCFQKKLSELNENPKRKTNGIISILLSFFRIR